MAKQTEGFLGGFSGKLGPVVGYRWKGVWCVRSKPTVVKNPRTEAQQVHRAMFKAEVQLAGRMRWALNIGFKLVADERNMTPMNLFVKGNQEAFGWRPLPQDGENRWDTGVLVVDYAALRVSYGPVAPVAVTEAAIDEDNVLNIRFEKNPLRRSCGGYDNVYFWVFNEHLQEGYLTNPVYRRAQKAAVALPDAFAAGGAEALHVYAFAQDEQGRCSESAYMGVGAGEAGVSGFSGSSGFSGLSGDSGLSGFSGESVDWETGEVLAAGQANLRGMPPGEGGEIMKT
jgi:hypothetical protein